MTRENVFLWSIPSFCVYHFAIHLPFTPMILETRRTSCLAPCMSLYFSRNPFPRNFLNFCYSSIGNFLELKSMHLSARSIFVTQTNFEYKQLLPLNANVSI